MYSTTTIRVNFFKDTSRANTDKVVYGRISEAIKTQNVNPDGTPVYEYESWFARFCGGAYNEALKLQDKDKIELTQWNVHNPYNKETKKSFPYVMITGFNKLENTGRDAGYQANRAPAQPQTSYAPRQQTPPVAPAQPPVEEFDADSFFGDSSMDNMW